MKFKKKPVVIEAVQFTGTPESRMEIMQLLNDGIETANYGKEIFIKTLEGVMRVSTQDWVIKGIKGEFYSCKPDIFEATYELVGE